MTKLSSERAIFSTKISQAWPMVTHAYRSFNGLIFGLISTQILRFIKIGQKMAKLSSEKAIFSTKIRQACPMVTHAYRPFNGLNFGMKSTYILNFINIGRKMMTLSSEKAIFWLKSVGRDSWSPMHIDILIDSSQCYYLPTFRVSLRLAEKWLSYQRRTPQKGHFYQENQTGVMGGHPCRTG